MASVAPYSTKSGSTLYMVRYKLPDGKWTVKRGFRNKTLASEWASGVSPAIASGSFVVPSNGRKRMGDIRKEAEPALEVAISRSRASTYRGSWANYVGPYWAHWKIGDITTADIRDWLAFMKASHTQSVMEDAFFTLSSTLRWAVEARIIPTSPATGVKLPRREHKRRNYLEHQEVELLATSATPHWTPFVRFLAYTGLRIGEASGLQVGDVVGNKLHILRSLDSGEANLLTTPTKGGQRRTVIIPDFLAHDLAARTQGLDLDEWAWRAPQAGPVRDNNFRNRVWAPALKKAKDATAAAQERAREEGAPLPRTFPHVTPHDLRHTAISLAVSAGANVLALSRMVGHADPSTTLRVYADLLDDDLHDVAARLDAQRTAHLYGAPARGAGPADRVLAHVRGPAAVSA